MLNVTIFYTVSDGCHFDVSGYCQNHIPLVTKLLNERGLKNVVVEIPEDEQSASASWVRVILSFSGRRAFESAMSDFGATLTTDAENYTDVIPDISFGRVVS